MVIVITGASSGLGEHLAVELGRRGHALGLVARRAQELDAVATKVRATGAKAAVAIADVTDREALFAAVGQVTAALGPVDVMVANAGGGWPTPSTRFDGSRITALMRLNFDGVVNAFDAVLPAMIARGHGQVVAVSSMAAWRGLAPSGAYSATKAAVSTLLQAMRTELAPYGIAVTTIHPGFVRTPMTAKNKFPMPFLIEPDRAARIMADGILARRRRVDFPYPTLWLVRLMNLIPEALFDPLFRRLSPLPGPERPAG